MNPNYSKDALPGLAEFMEKTKNKIEENAVSSLDPRIEKTIIDLKQKPRKKPMALSYGTDWKGDDSCLMGDGDYSVITGLSKSKKTFFKSMIEASYISGDGTDSTRPFKTHRKTDKMLVSIDTEQSIDDQLEAAHRVQKMAGEYKQAIYLDWSLESPTARVEMLTSFVNCYKYKIGLLILDGYIDFVEDYNNNKECFEFQLKIMSWAKMYGFHITGVLHKNPNGEKMIGHLGSIMERKASAIISLSKNPEDSSQSSVTHERARGRMEFDEFLMQIEKGIPHKIDII